MRIAAVAMTSALVHRIGSPAAAAGLHHGYDAPLFQISVLYRARNGIRVCVGSTPLLAEEVIIV